MAIIAKPCDLNALRNLAHLDSRVNERFHYWMTMLCGGFQPDEAFRGFLKDNGLPQAGLAEVRYRGYGCPGPTNLAYEDGQKASFHYLDFGVRMKANGYALRCKICPDGIGEAAVLSLVMRGMATRQRALKAKLIPALILLLPAQKGHALYQAAIEAGLITKSEIVDCDFCHAFSLIRLS